MKPPHEHFLRMPLTIGLVFHSRLWVLFSLLVRHFVAPGAS